jgi:5'-deoxynucleotidase YfbR-like HD superfamily hydrolase
VPKPRLSDLKQFVEELVLPFYQIERHTPLRFTPERWENDAEHSWSIALVACALAPHVDPRLDVGKICEFATVHDLVEVYAGDTSNFADADKIATKEQREAEAFKKLQNRFAKFPWVAETIEEYETQASSEARFVKSVDKIVPLLFDIVEEGLFYQEHKITLEAWQKKMQKHRQKASTHPGAFEYYDEVWNFLVARPEFFHQERK